MVYRCERLEYKRALGTLQNSWRKAEEPELENEQAQTET